MMELKDIMEVVASKEGICDFRVVEDEKQSYELFFVHGKLETARKADSLERNLTVYVNHDDKRGSNTFGISASMDRDELSARTDEAIKNAKLIFDEPYVLPNDETCDVLIESDLAHVDPKEAATKLADAASCANTQKGLDINALEVFVVKRVLHVVNNRGIDKTQTKYIAHIEAIPTANGENESVELFESYDLASLDVDMLKEEISARLEDAKARLSAKKPEQKLSCPIILNAYELGTLFKELASDANYANAYMHVNLHEVGDALQTAPEGDALCITVRGSMKDSAASNCFDLDGTNLTDREIVHDGRIVAGYGASRYAGYLGKTPTGALGCVDVRAGTTPIEALESEPHLELVYLSGLQVEPLSDYIGGEIRLAYYFDGEKKTPVTGIAFSGKLSDVLNTITLSAERTTLGAYSGPKKARLSRVNIF